ncbi:MAG: ABC transporter permease [Thermoplasmatota archaeon]
MFLLMLTKGHLGKSMMIVIAISASVSLTITMLSLSNGIKTSTGETIDLIGADAFVVPEEVNPLLMDLQRFDLGQEVIDDIRESPYSPGTISPRHRDTIFFQSGDQKGEVIIFGVVPEQEMHFGQFDLISGSWFDEKNDPVREHYNDTKEIDPSLITFEVMVSERFASRYDASIGKSIGLTTSFQNTTLIEYTITGIYEDRLSRTAPELMIHLGELQYIKGLMKRDTLTEILLTFDDEDEMRNFMEWSEGGDFRYRDVVDIHTRDQVLSEIQGFTNIIDGFSAMVISVTFLVSLIFISTLLMISTKQNGKDLAVLRTIGFARSRIIFIIIRESVMLSVMGSIFGLLLGGLLIYFLNDAVTSGFSNLPSSFVVFRADVTIISATHLIYLILGIASGCIPAVQWSLKSPMETMRGEAV